MPPDSWTQLRQLSSDISRNTADIQKIRDSMAQHNLDDEKRFSGIENKITRATLWQSFFLGIVVVVTPVVLKLVFKV